MANIEGAIRIDDSRIPVATSLDGALLIGLANGKTTAVPTDVINEELGKKAEHGYEENPKTLKEVDDVKANHGYGAEPQKTLKEVDDEVIQLAGDVKDTTEKAGASSLAELNARLLALEKIVSSTLRSKIEVTKEFNVWGKTNLILYGDGVNTKAPDFIGQKYIDTTNSNVYVAVGNSNAGNWKLV